MKSLSLAASAAFLCVCTAPAAAQVVASSVPASSATASTGVLRAGTPISLKMGEELSTKGKKLKVGHRFQLQVSDSVMLENQIVIPAGTPVTGEVTEVRNKGMWGKSGRINARVLFARVDGRQVRLTGQVDDKGKTGTAAVVGALAVAPIAGFFVTGTSAVLPLGMPVNAFLDEDVAVALNAPSKPLVATPVTQN